MKCMNKECNAYDKAFVGNCSEVRVINYVDHKYKIFNCSIFVPDGESTDLPLNSKDEVEHRIGSGDRPPDELFEKIIKKDSILDEEVKIDSSIIASNISVLDDHIRMEIVNKVFDCLNKEWTQDKPTEDGTYLVILKECGICENKSIVTVCEVINNLDYLNNIKEYETITSINNKEIKNIYTYIFPSGEFRYKRIIIPLPCSCYPLDEDRYPVMFHSKQKLPNERSLKEYIQDVTLSSMLL